MWLRAFLILSCVLATPSLAREREAVPFSRLVERGAVVTAASDEFVWVAAGDDIYMCVIEISERFRGALARRKVRDLLANWPTSLCFNAGSFE